MKPVVVDDVHRSYGETTALAGVSLSIDSGEVFSLVGPNGAGKTTFVRCLTGTVRPDSGTIELFGRTPRAVDPSRIGVLPQAFAPADRLTARELLDYYAGLYDHARDPSTVLESVGLDPEDDTYYENLSGGQQRRATVATALLNDPDLLFLDEPTTGIDPEGRRALWELLENLAGGGTTIFLTTHDMNEAERLADRVGLLADGRLVETGDPRTLVENYGGPNRLAVETDADPSVIDDLAFDVQTTEDGFVITDIDPEEIGVVVEALDARNVAFEALSWREPSLDDAYLELAGRRTNQEVTAR
ncbi:MAG: ABC transporter ATP-binding protein [Halodesulfurarchaeum sp.]